MKMKIPTNEDVENKPKCPSCGTIMYKVCNPDGTLIYWDCTC